MRRGNKKSGGFTLIELPAVSVRKRAAFTLVELLVVIGIIALMISILLPALGKARQQANSVSCQSNLRNIGQLMQIYASEHRGFTVPCADQTVGMYTTFADTLSVMATKKYASVPFPGQSNPNVVNFEASQTLAIFHDVDVPEGGWYDHSCAYVGNIRVMGAYNVWDVLTNNFLGFRPRQLSGIKRAAEVMMVWCGAVNINGGFNYGCYRTFPDALDGYQMFGPHGLCYPVPALASFQQAWYSNPIAIGAIPAGPSSKATGSVTMSYLKAANVDLLTNSYPGTDVCDMRFRHMNNNSINSLFCDMHVESRKLGTVVARDVCVNPWFVNPQLLTMAIGIRQLFKEQRGIGVAVGLLFVTVAVAVLARSYWPEKKADLMRTFYTDDDGQHWFTDSVFLVAPFDHNGKTAVVAQVYTYAGGGKQFCAYVQRFASEGKQQLDKAFAEARKRGEPPGSVNLFHDHNFLQQFLQVKLPGPGHEWINFSDPRANEILSIHSPDGSEVDQCFAYR